MATSMRPSCQLRQSPPLSTAPTKTFVHTVGRLETRPSLSSVTDDTEAGEAIVIALGCQFVSIALGQMRLLLFIRICLFKAGYHQITVDLIAYADKLRRLLGHIHHRPVPSQD